MAATGIITSFVGIVSVLYLIKKIKRRFEKGSVQGKVVLITGASSGLGEECAHVFHKAGAKVILCARREQELKRVRDALISAKETASEVFEPKVLVLDIADLKSIPEKAKEALGFHGHIDILINNAGQSYRGTVLETPIDVHMKIMTVNYFGQVALTKEILPSMISRNTGNIVMMSSVQGKIAVPYRSAYGASKHALQAYSDSLRSELFQTKIQVSLINPGYTKTNISLNAVTGDGSNYGAMDKAIAEGMSPNYVARKTLHAVIYRDPDVTVAPLSNHLVIMLRTICSALYFKIMSGVAKMQKSGEPVKD